MQGQQLGMAVMLLLATAAWQQCGFMTCVKKWRIER
jgi:hypothetical protein